MNITVLHKAMGDETRMKIITMLLKQNYCVRALAKNLALTEATVSQHLKILREADLLEGEKKGYFMHYHVKRDVLLGLAKKLEALAEVEQELCLPDENGSCVAGDSQHCHSKGACSDEVKEFCHGTERKREKEHGNCSCKKS